MSIEVKVPSVGESITEVTIASWTKEDGDYVEMDEIICELESDKATFELNAESAGILSIKVDEGETVDIGTLICEISPQENQNEESPKASADQKTVDSSAPSASNGAGKSAGSGKMVEMTVPSVGESITEVTISSWQKEDGEQVEVDDVICEIESDKATFELAAEESGILHHVAEEGDTLEIGALVCKIAVNGGTTTSGSNGSSQETTAQAPTETASSNDKQTYASGHPSPAAAKILAEKNINPSAVKGTGKDGRITKEDAQQAQAGTDTATKAEQKTTKQEAKPADQKTSGKPAADTQQTPAGNRNQRQEKMSNLRKTIARRLVSVKNETAMLTTFNEVDMQPVMDIRKKYKEMFKEKHEIGLGFMSFFVKAVCQALKEWPSVNAQIDGEQIIYSDFCDVSIAVSTPKGLVVPVVRNAEQMNFQQIESEIIRLATKARDGKLTIPEMTGGTFTITNGGVFGSMMSTPIINAPQSAILGMHNIVERPVAVNGEVKIRPIMYLALSYDHRIIDGRESVSFLVKVKQLLEDPIRLLLHV